MDQASFVGELKRRRVFRVLLEIISLLPIENDAVLLRSFWGPDGRAARRVTAFAEFARKIGFADLWERHGPPDGCRRVAPRDYACD